MTSSDVFDGIAAISQLVMALAVGLGVWVAYAQLHSWRDQRKASQVSDCALELLVAAQEASDQLKALRSPLDSIPQDKLKERAYPYQKRIERYNEAAPYFRRLRSAQIKAKAVIGKAEIDHNVDSILYVRHKAIVAIQMLAERDVEDIAFEDQPTKEMYKRMKREMYGTYSRKYDPLGVKQLEALEELHSYLRPLVKMSS